MLEIDKLKEVVLVVLQNNKHYSNKLKRMTYKMNNTIETRMSLNLAQLRDAIICYLSNITCTDFSSLVDQESFLFMLDSEHGNKLIKELEVQYRLKT
jgi:hypothetical protein